MKFMLVNVCVFGLFISGYPPAASADHETYIEQVGAYSREELERSADARLHWPISTVENLQKGLANNATVEQGGNYNESVVIQNGYTNWARHGSYGDGHVGFITQTGNDNWLDLTQVGTGNRADLVQSGSENQADLLQDGNRFWVILEQRGDGNRLEFTQANPNLPSIEIIQSGGAALTLQQTD